MSSKWEDFITQLKDDAGILAKDELKSLVKDAKSDSEEFLKRQGAKLERYLNELAEGTITRDQFKGYITDIKDLTEMEALKMSTAAKVRAQRLVVGIVKLILKGLLSLI